MTRIGSEKVDTYPAAMIGPARQLPAQDELRSAEQNLPFRAVRRAEGEFRGFRCVGGTKPNSRTAEHEVCQPCCYLWARVHPRCETELLRAQACFLVRFLSLSLSTFLLFYLFSLSLSFSSFPPSSPSSYFHSSVPNQHLRRQPALI